MDRKNRNTIIRAMKIMVVTVAWMVAAFWLPKIDRGPSIIELSVSSPSHVQDCGTIDPSSRVCESTDSDQPPSQVISAMLPS